MFMALKSRSRERRGTFFDREWPNTEHVHLSSDCYAKHKKAPARSNNQPVYAARPNNKTGNLSIYCGDRHPKVPKNAKRIRGPSREYPRAICTCPKAARIRRRHHRLTSSLANHAPRRPHTPPPSGLPSGRCLGPPRFSRNGTPSRRVASMPRPRPLPLPLPPLLLGGRGKSQTKNLEAAFLVQQAGRDRRSAALDLHPSSVTASGRIGA
jgi:hypothetical protein